MTGSASEGWMERFFALSPELLFVASRDGALLHGSAALRQALGPVVEHAATLAALAHPDDRGTLDDAWSCALATSEPLRFDVRLRGERGTYVRMSCRVKLSPDDGRVYGSLLHREGQDAEDHESLRLKSLVVDSLVNNANVSAFVTDRDGVFRYYATNEPKRAGIDPRRMIGRNILEIYAGHPQIDRMRRALAGESIHAQDEALGKQFEYWMVPARDEQGAPDGVVGISLDVTATKMVENELRMRLDQIQNQQEVIRNLSTPIIEVWSGVLTLPMVGVVDSVRTADVMDRLLTRIVDKQARFAILDLTGVEVVDTSVASHLIQLITAIGLLGAEGIVAGIKPTVAQTMVALGLDLSTLNTQRDLRAALAYAIRAMGRARDYSAERASRVIA